MVRGRCRMNTASRSCLAKLGAKAPDDASVIYKLSGKKRLVRELAATSKCYTPTIRTH